MYDSETGWGTTDDPVPPIDGNDDYDEQLKQAGFVHFSNFFKSSEFDSLWVTAYSRTNAAGREQFLVEFNTSDTCRSIFCPDFGSAVECIRKLEPLCHGKLDYVVEDLHELLTQYGTVGPLSEGLFARQEETRRLREQRNRRREEENRKPNK
jgi:hypothetical protein